MDGIIWVGTDNYDVGRQGNQVHGITYHITQSTNLPDYWFNEGSRKAGTPVSAHYAIDRDGTVHQYVHLTDTAWHTGFISRPDMSNPMIASIIHAGINPNLRLIGIEHVCLSGQSLTQVQIFKSIELSRFIWSGYYFNRDSTHMIRHSQINSTHNCPGATFPLYYIIKEVAAK